MRGRSPKGVFVGWLGVSPFEAHPKGASGQASRPGGAKYSGKKAANPRI